MLCHSTVAARLTTNTEQKAQRVLLLYSLLPQLYTWDSCQDVGNGSGECKAAHQCVGLLPSKDVSMDLTPLTCFCNTWLCEIDVFSWLPSASTSLISAWMHFLHFQQQQQHLKTTVQRPILAMLYNMQVSCPLMLDNSIRVVVPQPITPEGQKATSCLGMLLKCWATALDNGTEYTGSIVIRLQVGHPPVMLQALLDRWQYSCKAAYKGLLGWEVLQLQPAMQTEQGNASLPNHTPTEPGTPCTQQHSPSEALPWLFAQKGSVQSYLQ